MSLDRRKGVLSRFFSNVGGNALVLFALCLPVMVLAIGAAVDFSRGADAHVKIQSSLDAAVLAGAKRLSEGEDDLSVIESVARETFLANIADANGIFLETPTITFQIDETNGIFQARGEGRFDNSFSALAGEETTEVSAVSQAGFNALDIEMALMLDVTGSMSGSKIADLKSAAKSVVDMLVSGSANPGGGSRISLVPYSAAVNAGDFAAAASGGQSTSCVVERVGPESDTDQGPASAPVGVSPAAYCPSAEVVPLSNDAESLKAKINAMSTGGCTAGHLGVAWSYYTLSPNWSGVFPAASAPSAYDADNKLKVAILMTDGKFNTYYDGPSDPTCSPEAATASRDLTLDLCGAMRDDGIVVYSVAYQAPSSAESLLRDCADSDDNYFETETGDQLVAAFQEIADEVRNLRLTQ